jgi:hypothetical protein
MAYNVNVAHYTSVILHCINEAQIAVKTYRKDKQTLGIKHSSDLNTQ